MKNMITRDELYAMELHEEWTDGDDTQITRVEGGWIYKSYRLSTSVFVPEPQF
jgi:hypothetical protein